MSTHSKTLLALFEGATDQCAIEIEGHDPDLYPNPDFQGSVADHLKGVARLGIFALRDDSTVKWATVLFDWRAIGGAWNDVLTYYEFVAKHGVPAYIEKVSDVPDAEEYRIWMFFEQPIPVDRVVPTVRASIVQAGLSETIPSIPGIPEILTGESQFVWLPFFGGNPTTAFVDRGGRRIGGAGKFTDKVKRTSIEAFEKLEAAMIPFIASMQDQRANFVGTSAGLQLVVQNCPFVKWCEETADKGIPGPLMSALMTNLCRFGKGGVQKLVTIAKRGRGKFNQDEFIARIATMIGVEAPLTYQAIKSLGWPGTAPQWPASPAGWGIYLDLGRVILSLAALPQQDQEDAIREHFKLDFNHIPAGKQQLWLDDLATKLGVQKDLLAQLARTAFLHSELSGWNLREAFAKSDDYNLTPEEKGSVMFRWLTGNGGKTYLDDSDKCIVAWKDFQVEIGPNNDFKAYLFQETGLTFKSPKVGRIVEAFRSEALLHAVRVNQLSWFQTDRSTTCLYLHMNAADGQIFKISPSAVSRLDNGANDDRVLLLPSPKMRSFAYAAPSTTEYKNALKDFNALVLQGLACSPDNRLLCGCWILAYPLLDFVVSRPHLRCEGSTGKGKSRGMDAMSMFIYGSSELDKITEAASYAVGSRNPAVFIDQIETKDMTPALTKFILTAVSGIQNVKRKPGTVGGVVSEPIRCLIGTSGIDGMKLPELINRTFHIEFDKDKYGSPDFAGASINHAIRVNRDKMVSAQLHLLARVMKRISDGEEKAWRFRLRTEFPDHILGRSNEYLALMALVAEELLAAISARQTTTDLVKKWIDDQNEYGTVAAAQSNQLVAIVEAIFNEADRYHSATNSPKWPYELPCDGRSLKGNASRLLLTFTKAAAKNRLSLDYRTENLVSRRLKNASDIFRSMGFQISWQKDTHKKHDVFTIERMPVGESTSDSVN